MSEENITEQPKRKRGRPPKNKSDSNQKANNSSSTKEKKSYEREVRPTEFLFSEKKRKNEHIIVPRKRALSFEEAQKILLQNAKRNSSNRSFTKYTKALVRDYLLNPFQYKTQIRGLSQYLFRSNTLYKKIILYYACMPMYNYNVVEKIDLTKAYNPTKAMKSYQNVIQRLFEINLRDSFAQMVALALINGAYFGFVYDEGSGGMYFHNLDPDYCKIVGRDKRTGKIIIAYDMSWFAKGNNSEFVDGIDGDMTGCWDPLFQTAWQEYNNDKQNKRWFIIPPERSMCIPAGLDDEYDILLPFFLGIFTQLMSVDELEDAISDKTELENYKLLVGQIPLIKNSDVVDDYAVSPELVEEFTDGVNEVVPNLVTSVASPLEYKTISFENSNSTKDVDMLNQSIQNVFNQAGATQLVVAGGSSTNSIGLRQNILNDASLAFDWVSRIELEFNYVINQLIDENYTMKIHRETWYTMEEYLAQKEKEMSFGGDPMEYFTANNKTPYEVWCGLTMAKNLTINEGLNIRDLMIVPDTSFTKSNSDDDGGRPQKSDDDLSGSGIATRDGNKNEGTKANK